MAKGLRDMSGRGPLPWRLLHSESAHTHVLEAVIIATIMVSAVAYVATFDSPSGSTTPTREFLQNKIDDAITILYDTPVTGSALGDNMLSVFLVECMQGDCTNLTDKLDKLVPAGASYALYVSNGYDTYPIYVVREPGGEAVTATHLLEPKWSHSFVATARNSVNPTTDPLLVYSLPVFNSNPVSQGGSPLRVLVHGTRLADGSNYTLMGSFSTLAGSAAQSGQMSAVSMNFLVPIRNASTQVVEAWVTGAVGDWTNETIHEATRAPKLTPATFHLEINETAGVAIPNGTELTVSLPRGWLGNASQAVNNHSWLVLENATSWNSSYTASDIRAKLVREITGSSVRFTFNATYFGDAINYYPFHATLSKGAQAEANLLVRADTAADDTQTFRAPGMTMSVPRPLGTGTNTTWSLAIDIPFTASGISNYKEFAMRGLERAIDIERIEITEQTGANIFGSVNGLRWGNETRIFNTTKGTWVNEGYRLVWTGRLESTDGPHFLTFNVTASGTAGPGASKNPFTPPVKFDNYKGRLLAQNAQGLYRQVVLPDNASLNGRAYEGYNHAFLNGSAFEFTSDSIYRSTLLPGESNYTIEQITTAMDSLYGSYVNVETPNVPIGGQVVLTADVQSMLFALADAGFTAGVKLRFYPPWSTDTRKPIYEQDNLDSGLLNSQVLSMTLLDVNDDGYPDPIVGTNNGRVLALHALSGARLQGGAWVVPSFATNDPNGQINNTVAQITHLSTIRLGGVDHIVVSTDKQSGVFILDKNLTRKWTWTGKVGDDTVALDASVDIDMDGRNDIVVSTRNATDPTSSFRVYVLEAPAGSSDLVPILPATPTAFQNAFYVGTGTPSGLVGFPRVGPAKAVPGFGVGLRSMAGARTMTAISSGDPQQVVRLTSINTYIESPRHGLSGVDWNGSDVWTFFGTPVQVARPFDYNGDVARDLLGGSPNGYVYALNGQIGVSPAYAQIPVGSTMIIDGDGHDVTRQAFLTNTGEVWYTRDGWMTRTCIGCDPDTGLAPLLVDARGLALNATASAWIAGLNNMLYRTYTSSTAPEFPLLVPETPSATKVMVPGLGPVAYNIATDPQNFYDIHFGWGPNGDKGWVVGGSVTFPADIPCTLGELLCPEGFVMRTTDGGRNWHVLSDAEGTLESASGGKVSATLTRINFTTATLGWITGTNGTLLRSNDGGVSWRGVSVPTTVPLRDIACAPASPDYCVLVGGSGVVLRTRDATAPTPTWTNISTSLRMGAYPKDLFSVGVGTEESTYIGGHNALWRSVDGGENWTTVPMGYVETDVNRLVIQPEGTGFAYGGNTTVARYLVLHDFLTESYVISQNLLPDLPGTARIVGANANMETSAPSSSGGAAPPTDVTLFLSGNGGQNWAVMAPGPSFAPVVRSEWNTTTMVSEKNYVGTITDDAHKSNDFRFRIDFDSQAAFTHLTRNVKALDFNVTYLDTATMGLVTRYVHVNFTDATAFDAARSTAAWDTYAGAAYSARAEEFWVRNVTGSVLDMETGYNISGDSHHDVWVATGGVLSGNAPDYAVYTSLEDLDVGVDNRVYLLDGKNGSLVANTSPFAGNVTQLALSDGDGDGDVDFVYAATYHPDLKRTMLHALYPRNLTVAWERTMTVAEPTTLAAGNLSGPLDVAYLGTKPPANTAGAIASRLYAVNGPAANISWTANPDHKGKYVITKEIPTDWMFGPYVVEIVVEWTDKVATGVGQTRDVFQSARFYDYFMVTPPDSLSPPSPVYNVHLVAWFEDWS